MTDLEKICKYALYEEQQVLDDSKSVIKDPSTGKLYFKKTLSVYNISVFSWLSEHSHPVIPRIDAFWLEDERLVVIEEYIQGRTLANVLSEISATDSPGREKKKAEIILLLQILQSIFCLCHLLMF